MARHVILHYHLFKNAGTSLDAALKAAFGDAWAEAEGSNGHAFVPADVGAWLLAHPDVRVLSSHTAMLPPPQIPDIDILPVIFVRQPLDRVRSVYDFERQQQRDTQASRMAKQLSLMGYVDWRLNIPGDRAIRDFHAYRLAAAIPGAGSERERAFAALDLLPFVGVVEAYDRSLEHLQALMRKIMPEISLGRHHRNATKHALSTLEARVERLRSELGDALFDQLMAANEVDIALHQAALARMHEAAS